MADRSVAHNLKRMGFGDHISMFKDNGIDMDLFMRMTPAMMAAVFQGKARLLYQFEEKYKEMSGDWHILETQRGSAEDLVPVLNWTKVKMENPEDWAGEEDFGQEDPLSCPRVEADRDRGQSVEDSETQFEIGGSESNPATGSEGTVIETSADQQRNQSRKRPSSGEGTSEPFKKAALETNVVQSYLEANLLGRTILKAGMKGVLDNVDRLRICHEVIWAELESDPHKCISESRFLSLSKFVVDLFPGEVSSYYYTPRIPKNGETNPVAPKGALYDKYHNILKYLRKHGMRCSQRKTTGGDGDSEAVDGLIPPSVNSHIDWLERNSQNCDEKTREKWRVTSEYRRNLLWNLVCTRSKPKVGGDKIAAYFNQFRCLGLQWGLKLILEDFDNWFKNRWTDAIQEWPTISRKLLTYLKLEKANSETGTTVALLLAIPKLFKQPLMQLPASKGGKKRTRISWKPNNQESTNGFLLHVKNLADLDVAINQMRANCGRVGKPLQPLPAIVGQNVDTITDSFIIFNNFRYTAKSPLVAFDYCFKIYQALHTLYPVQSSYSWLFVQHAFYNLTSESDPALPCVDKAVNEFKRLA